MNWDQRIPNEPLFDRQFLVERPPIISQDRPRNTSQCAPDSQPWLVINHDTEREMMNYWHRHVVNRDVKGVNSKDAQEKSLDMTKDQSQNQNRPWLHGIHRNIDRDSQLSNRNYYNPRDCIVPLMQHRLNGLNARADSAMLKQMTENQLFRNGILCDGRLWNKSTSIRMNEPN